MAEGRKNKVLNGLSSSRASMGHASTVSGGEAKRKPNGGESVNGRKVLRSFDEIVREIRRYFTGDEPIAAIAWVRQERSGPVLDLIVQLKARLMRRADANEAAGACDGCK